MAWNEHPYCLPDTTVSLRLLCGTDFPDAVPFLVTDLAMTPMDTGRPLF